jgi:hypothetical protein
MKLSFQKKVLLSLGVVAGIGALAGAGTFATFTAQTTNPTNTFADGTLVLSNKVGTGTACLSTGGLTTDVNANGSCDTAFSLSVKAPGDSSTANLTLQNKGSLAASVLKVFSAACTDADAAGENYHGTGSPCGVVQFYVQQYSDSAFSTPSACLYGGATGVTCDFSDTAKTLTAFVTAFPDVANGLSAGSLAAAGGADTTWIKVGVKLPSTAGNTYQGRSASLALNWHITQ